jgi:transposase
MIMTLCLLIYGALEYRIQQTLQQHQQTFPTQLGTTTAKPEIVNVVVASTVKSDSAF